MSRAALVSAGERRDSGMVRRIARAFEVDQTTPMGATLVEGGVTFRLWAPDAREAYVVTEDEPTDGWRTWSPRPERRLERLGDGTFAGGVVGLGEGAAYLYWIVGPEDGSSGFKRDPYARELATSPLFPNCPCLVRSDDTYPWRCDFRQRPYHEWLIYQLHIGAFWAVDAEGRDQRRDYGRFLDVIERLPYLRALGVTAVQFLPVQEFDTAIGLGYAGLDYFSPEMAYQIDADAELSRRLPSINAMFAGFGCDPLSIDDLRPGPNQLKALIDLCHLHGLSVVFDLVYNHAGGGLDDRSLYYFDRQRRGDDNRSQYFTDQGHAGGKVFAYWKEPVRQFLIDNARFFLEHFRIDGIRYDEVTVMHHHGGDRFCKDLTSTLRYHDPSLLQVAEYWDGDRHYAISRPPGGLGFDAGSDDRLRVAVRRAVSQAAGGASAALDLDAIAAALQPRFGFAGWASVQSVEDHDRVLWDFGQNRPREPRIASLADPSNPRSWYARSRARVALGLVATAPGIPFLFMGQEFLEDKPWSDDVNNWSRFLIWWEGVLGRDSAMVNHHRFTSELFALRREQPALQGDRLNTFHVHNDNRVIAYHRWLEGYGRDVVIALTLREQTHYGYRIGMPRGGRWREIFNSDVYDNWVNPIVAGNSGSVTADGPSLHGLPSSASVVIPANGFVVLAHEG
jgi:1,4-alpha-glucan branching enzyme